jgi:uncharacterized protein
VKRADGLSVRRGNAGVVCVFAKAPVRGKVKTRLACAIGEARATALAHAFLVDTWSAVTALDGARAVLWLDGDGELPELEPAAEIRRQIDSDLGGRMEHALAEAIGAGAPWAIAVGTDSPGLPRRMIEAARAALDRGAPAALGPTLDGGFYLLGLARCPRGLLSALPWSAPDTYRATLERLEERGLHPVVLERWFDVDAPPDLERLEREIAAGTSVAPATARVLKR